MTAQSLLEKKANLVRSLVLTSTTTAGSGHPTSCLSSVDLTTVLFEKYLHYDLSSPDSFLNDRFVLSKGHAAPLLYALFGMSGAYPLSQLNTLREFGSEFEGHPTSHFTFAQGATGSLGQGLSIGAGLALGIRKKLSTHDLGLKTPKVYVLLGDGEMAEGQNWEAANFASNYHLSNLVAIVDVNSLGQSQKTMFESDVSEYEKRFMSFGFQTVVIDGHDLEAIDAAFEKAQDSDGPFAIIASTIKGKGVSFIEGKSGWHGKALTEDELQKALVELSPVDASLRFELKIPDGNSLRTGGEEDRKIVKSPIFSKGDMVATREAYGLVLMNLGNQDESSIVLDGDVQNSTHTQEFAEEFPDRFIQCFIAEQNMVSVAVGLSKLSFKPVVSTFASFFTRSADQIRMAAISGSTIHFCGSHVGVSIGDDGPSQMGLEDIALFGAIPGTIIIQPSDAVSMQKILPEVLLQPGITYIRSLRPKTQVIYSGDENFIIGGSKVLLQSSDDLLTVLATGITVHEALSAGKELMEEGIYIRVVDCYSIKPIDKKEILASIDATREKVLITVEDHFQHGGFGDFVLDAVSKEGVRVVKLSVKDISRSGTKEQLLHAARIDKDAIIEEVRKVLREA